MGLAPGVLFGRPGLPRVFGATDGRPTARVLARLIRGQFR
jgi:hypothetical protein